MYKDIYTVIDWVSEHQDENVSILEEAAAIRFVIKKSTLEKEQKRDLTVDEVSTSLLAEVQEMQEKEMAGTISRLGRMVGWRHNIIVCSMSLCMAWKVVIKTITRKTKVLNNI